MRQRNLLTIGLICSLLSSSVLFADESSTEDGRVFRETVRPVLLEYCSDCHEPGESKGGIEFLGVDDVTSLQSKRSVWRSLAAQLHNRTMPPPKKKQPTEEERVLVSTWINSYLRKSACDEGPYAGYVTARRLTRLEYDNTVRDLVGVRLGFSDSFPADGGSGEGFDNNGESLFSPPMLLERYLEAAQSIVDAAIVSPPIDSAMPIESFLPSLDNPGSRRAIPLTSSISTLVSIYVDAKYEVSVTIAFPKSANPAGTEAKIELAVDGVRAADLNFAPDKNSPERTVTRKEKLRLSRGAHALSLRVVDGKNKLELTRLHVKQVASKPSAEKAERHERLLGVKLGETPDDPRESARRVLRRFVERAYRRPVEAKEADRFLALYDRGAKRGDPFPESVKLALRGVLISPDFLFRLEKDPQGEAIEAIGDFELASRLSYFLWATMPDAELLQLAREGQLRRDDVLRAQVDRMIADPRSRDFAEAFIGQWLGTKDVGGRIAPTSNDVQEFYKPEIASDMREEVVLFFDDLLRRNESLLLLIDSDYTFLSARLAKFYGMNETSGLPKKGLARFQLPNRRRGGVLGMGAVLALTSHHKRTSPVLRGAWVFDTLLGTPVPAPPPDIPPLKRKSKGRVPSMREQLAEHREHSSCKACHDLIDPIGFGLEHFDWVGRWRAKVGGRSVDATGVMPSGESFDGSAELRKVLLGKKTEFARQISRKLLGYALGRGLDDRDECTIAELILALENSGFRARSLIHSIVLSTPFRNRQRVNEEDE